MSIEKCNPSRSYLKHEKEEPYTKNYNETINAITDCAALGIYIYLSSKPENWEINVKQLMNHFSKGRDFIKSKLKYLRQIGALSTNDVRDEKGKFVSRHTTLHKRVSSTVLKIQPLDNPDSGESLPTNKRIIQTKETTTTTTEIAEKEVRKKEEEVRKEKEEEAIAEAVEFEKKRISKQDNANQDIYQQVIQVFNEVIPERKAPLRPTKKLKSNIDELIEIWPDISKQGFMFSIERFKKYLLKLRKTSFPLGTYTDTNGQEQRRNIVMILSPDVFINTMSS